VTVLRCSFVSVMQVTQTLQSTCCKLSQTSCKQQKNRTSSEATSPTTSTYSCPLGWQWVKPSHKLHCPAVDSDPDKSHWTQSNSWSEDIFRYWECGLWTRFGGVCVWPVRMFPWRRCITVLNSQLCWNVCPGQIFNEKIWPLEPVPTSTQ